MPAMNEKPATDQKETLSLSNLDLNGNNKSAIENLTIKTKRRRRTYRQRQLIVGLIILLVTAIFSVATVANAKDDIKSEAVQQQAANQKSILGSLFDLITGTNEEKASQSSSTADPAPALFDCNTGNLNLLTPVAFSSSNSNSVPANVADNDPQTVWDSAGGAPQWIQMDLGQYVRISKVRLHIAQSTAGRSVHQVFAGATANNMSLIATFDGNTQDLQWLEILSSVESVRYLKIQTTVSPSNIAWREIQVFGGSSVAPPTAPTPTPSPSPTVLTPVSITASQVYSSAVPGYVSDGNLQTAWSAGGFAPQWIQMDLGELSNVSKVRLNVAQDPAGQTTHQIYIGATADNLTLAGTLNGSTQTQQWLELSLIGNNVRYVKVLTTSSPSWVGWFEIEVIGDNSSSLSPPVAPTILTPVSATASKSWDGPYGNLVPSYAYDGNLSSPWVADGFPPQWIQFDLGQLSKVSKIRLKVVQDPAGQTTHEIYFGSTPDNLTLAGTLTGYTENQQWLELPLIYNDVRYVKVLTTSSPAWVGWREIEVIGKH